MRQLAFGSILPRTHIGSYGQARGNLSLNPEFWFLAFFYFPAFLAFSRISSALQAISFFSRTFESLNFRFLSLSPHPYDKPVSFFCLKEPFHPLPSVLRKSEKKFPLMAAMRDMPYIPWQIVSVGSRHSATSFLRNAFLASKRPF